MDGGHLIHLIFHLSIFWGDEIYFMLLHVFERITFSPVVFRLPVPLEVLQFDQENKLKAPVQQSRVLDRPGPIYGLENIKGYSEACDLCIFGALEVRVYSYDTMLIHVNTWKKSTVFLAAKKLADSCRFLQTARDKVSSRANSGSNCNSTMTGRGLKGYWAVEPLGSDFTVAEVSEYHYCIWMYPLVI